MGRSRYQITDEKAPHFITCTVLHWLPLLTNPETVGIVLSSLKHLQSEGLKIYAWVVLEDHLHLVVQSNHLSEDVARFNPNYALEIT